MLLKKINSFVFLFFLIFTCACKKDDSSIAQAPGTKTIGNNGGVVSSDNKIVSITIPNQAVSSNLTFSIKPTQNIATDGIGSTYILGPEGTKFDKPVTLSFNYTDADALLTPPELMAVAFKKSDNTWEIVPDAVLDLDKKSISVKTSHFSEWSIIKSKEGVSFSTKAFSLLNIPGKFMTDTLLLTAQGQSYNLVIGYNGKPLIINKKYPLISLSIVPMNYSDGTFGIFPFNKQSIKDTNISFLQLTTIAGGKAKYNVGKFSALVKVLGYISKSSDTTKTITAMDTLRGTFRTKP